MAEIASKPRLVVLAQRKDLASLLKTMLDQLGRCQKALNELLEVILPILDLFPVSHTHFYCSGETFDLSSILLHW